MSFAIIFSGKIASGKSTYAKSISSTFHIPIVSFGSFLISYCEKKGVSITRENLQKEGKEWVKERPQEFLENVLKSLNKNTDYIIFDGVRHVTIYNLIKKKYSTTLLIFIDVKDEIRYDRYLTRIKQSDKKISLEEFINLDYHSTESELDLLKKIADIVLDYKNDFKSNHKKLVEIISSYFK